MLVTYAPEDGDSQTWEFNPRRVKSRDAELIEQRYGANWATFLNDTLNGSMRARRVLLWHLLRREHPKLRYDDTPDFYAGELTVEMSRGELLDARTKVEQNQELSDDVRERVLAALDEEIANTSDAEGDDVEGKAPASSAG